MQNLSQEINTDRRLKVSTLLNDEVKPAVHPNQRDLLDGSELEMINFMDRDPYLKNIEKLLEPNEPNDTSLKPEGEGEALPSFAVKQKR